MSIGAFVGVRASFNEDYAEDAESLLESINHALLSIGEEPYHDPEQPPDVYDPSDSRFGRAATDHVGVSAFDSLLMVVKEHSVNRHRRGLLSAPERYVFLPMKLREPLTVRHPESDEPTFEVYSADELLDGLRALAPRLGIPFGGDLRPGVAERINSYESFGESEPPPYRDARTAWLLLHEGAALAIQHRSRSSSPEPARRRRTGRKQDVAKARVGLVVTFAWPGRRGRRRRRPTGRGPSRRTGGRPGACPAGDPSPPG